MKDLELSAFVFIKTSKKLKVAERNFHMCLSNCLESDSIKTSEKFKQRSYDVQDVVWNSMEQREGIFAADRVRNSNQNKGGNFGQTKSEESLQKSYFAFETQEIEELDKMVIEHMNTSFEKSAQDIAEDVNVVRIANDCISRLEEDKNIEENEEIENENDGAGEKVVSGKMQAPTKIKGT